MITGLYCKDPDDNTFHPVNSTWRSSTFCGNYTCKIRKKNNTLDESSSPVNSLDQINDQDHAGSELYTIKEKKSELSEYDNDTYYENNPNYILHRDAKARKRDEVIRKFEDNIIASLGEKGDRYLTTEEINTITDLLHTVKKSDLEAILEVYTLAKDIFNEIDEKTLEKFSEKESSKLVPTKTGFGELTYFHDPYTTNVYNKQNDLRQETSNTVNSMIPTPTYNGPFLRNRNEKSLEYYPASNFHRTSSYYYPFPTQVVPTAPTNVQRTKPTANGPCCPQDSASPSLASYTTEIGARPQLMPYPFTYVQRSSAYTHDTNPWSQPYAYPIAYSQKTQQLAPSYIYRPPQTNPEVMNTKNEYQTDTLEEIYGAPHKSKLIEKLVPTVGTNKPAWQTAQLSPEVIDDVRANILQKTEKILNIIPRKKIKFERVAKVLKIDELARSKREVEDDNNVEQKVIEAEDVLEEYEAYIDKET